MVTDRQSSPCPLFSELLELKMNKVEWRTAFLIIIFSYSIYEKYCTNFKSLFLVKSAYFHCLLFLHLTL